MEPSGGTEVFADTVLESRCSRTAGGAGASPFVAGIVREGNVEVMLKKHEAVWILWGEVFKDCRL